MKTEPKYKTEMVDCALCGFQFKCQPDNPEDLCECPECKKKSAEKEYRWENVSIGQGHYYKQLRLCIKDAYEKSIGSPMDTFLVEEFRPKRRQLCRFKNGEELQ